MHRKCHVYQYSKWSVKKKQQKKEKKKSTVKHQNALQQSKMATTKMQTPGFKIAVHKPLGDITDATSILYIQSMVITKYV